MHAKKIQINYIKILTMYIQIVQFLFIIILFINFEIRLLLLLIDCLYIYIYIIGNYLLKLSAVRIRLICLVL